MKLRAMLLVLAATLMFAREKDSYSAHYRAGSLNIVPARADARQYAWEEKARGGVRFRIGADSVIITRKKLNVVIPFEAISKITCGSDTHPVATMGQKFAATMVLGLPGLLATTRIDSDTYVELTWGLNNDTALFQFDKNDYIPVLLALRSKTGKTPVEDNIGVRLALESKSGRLPTEASQSPTARKALAKQVAQPTDSMVRSDDASGNQAAPSVKTPSAASQSGQAAASPIAPNHQPPVAAPLPRSRSKDATQAPKPKCDQGTYWGDDPSGKPICVWNH